MVAFSKLPHDVFTQILLETYHVELPRAMDFHRRTALVSRAWSTANKDIPELWTRIIATQDEAITPGFVEKSLALSKARLLDLHFEFYEAVDLEACLNSLLPVLLPQMHRWCSLSLSPLWFGPRDDGLYDSITGVAPNLKDVSFISDSEPWGEGWPIPLSCPTIRQLTFPCGRPENVQILGTKFDSVQRLHLRSNSSMADANAILRVVSELPQLSGLRLSIASLRKEVTDPVPTLLATLTELHCDSVLPEVVAHIISAIKAPELQTVIFHQPETLNATTLWGFIAALNRGYDENRFSSLRRLLLVRLALGEFIADSRTPEDIVPVFPAQIKTLELLDCDDDVTNLFLRPFTEDEGDDTLVVTAATMTM